MTAQVPELPDAACRIAGAARIFDSVRPADIAYAKRICAGCPDRADCLDWGLRHEDYLVWGGMDEKQLRALREQLGIDLDELRYTTTQKRPNRNPRKPREDQAEAHMTGAAA